MNRFHIKYIGFLAIIALWAACDQDFEDLETDPNRPASSPASIILSGLLTDMNAIEPWDKEHRQNQYYCKINTYYGDQRYDWGSGDFSYNKLKNVEKMEEEAIAAGQDEVNPYSAVAKFLKAWFYTDMLLKFGDIPMSEALQGMDNTTPVYDSQKDGFNAVLQLLEDANTEFASLDATDELAGDFYFDNDLEKWQKATNTFRLRILIHLSKRAGDNTDMNIATQFADMLSNPTTYPVMESVADNLQYVYNTINKYPKTPSSFGWSTRDVMAQTYVKTLTDLRDPRIFVVAEPADSLSSNDIYQNYAGAPSGMDQSEMEANTVKGLYSRVSKTRYYATEVGEPNIHLGYIEMCFNIAEAINRGWASGSAEDYYNEAITQSFQFYDIADSAAAYLAQTDIAYAGDNADGLEQILTQKYIAFFNQSGREAYYNYRRTGIPTFDKGPGTGNSERIAVRFKYPESEQTYNEANYTAAIQSQFGGTDDINNVIWLIQ